MRKTITFITALLVVLTLAGYWGLRNFSFSTSDSSYLRLALDDKIESLDPAKAFSDDSLLVSAQVLEPLYQYHYLKRPYEIQPLLADGLPQIVNNGTLVKIKIKKNIHYHSHPAFGGEKRLLRVEDFMTQIKRMALKSLKSPGRGLFNGLIVGFEEYSELINHNWEKISTTELKGVFAEGDDTLCIELTRSEPNIIYYLALNFLSPVPWEVVKFYKNELDRVLIGTGPYFLKSNLSTQIDMEKNPEYRDDYYPTSGDRYANVEKLLDSSKEKIPFINRIRFYITGDENERWNKFMNKEIDLLTVPKPLLASLYDDKGQIKDELKDRDVIVKHFPTLANRWLAFNMRDPLVGRNENLRRAIAHGIDYTKYIQVLSQNTNLRANSILVPGISGYLPTRQFRFNYDPALALAYMKKAGFTSTNMPTLTYSTRGNQGVNLLEAEFIKDQLEKISIKVNIQVLTFSEFLSRGRAGELMFFTDNWLFDYPDGENILQLLLSTNFPGVNKSAYSNKKVDELYWKLKETTHPDARDRIIHEMEEIVFDDLPWIPMMYESSFVAHYPELKNFRKSSVIRNYVKYLKIEN
jgi:oligopeptide transport system substrate-binding protein